jgi:hypothetical protein
MYFYPRRSGNSPRLSGNFLWRKGSYPVSEYSDLRFLSAVRRDVSAEMPNLSTGAVALRSSPDPARWHVGCRPEACIDEYTELA